MKRYIIMTYDIHPLGGCQNYLSGKCPYLENKGYEVYILYSGSKATEFVFKNLAIYSNGNVPGLDFIPAEMPSSLREKMLRVMKSKVTRNDSIYDETIVESHYDKMHLWGELLAESLNAKHICFNCNEIFRGEDKYYEQYLDFYKFKYERNELYGIVEKSMEFLFGGFDGLIKATNKRFRAAHPGSVQDVNYFNDSIVPEADWSICYIGRILKSYVNRILSDVAAFSEEHEDKKINFIIIGDAEPRLGKIHSIFDRLDNVNLTLLGNLVPIPRLLIKKMDVLIAGAGSAFSVVKENVPVIVPDPNTCLSNGLLGYENKSAILLEPGRKHESFKQSLERVLIEKVHTRMNLKYEYHVKPLNEYYDEHMSMIDDSERQKKYYTHGIICNGPYSLLHKLYVCLKIIKRNWI